VYLGVLPIGRRNEWLRLRFLQHWFRPNWSNAPSRPGSCQIDIEGLCNGLEDRGSLSECLAEAASIRLWSRLSVNSHRWTHILTYESMDFGEFRLDRVGLRHGTQSGIPFPQRPAVFRSGQRVDDMRKRLFREQGSIAPLPPFQESTCVVQPRMGDPQ
jgi:hypothetical protein